MPAPQGQKVFQGLATSQIPQEKVPPPSTCRRPQVYCTAFLRQDMAKASTYFTGCWQLKYPWKRSARTSCRFLLTDSPAMFNLLIFKLDLAKLFSREVWHQQVYYDAEFKLFICNVAKCIFGGPGEVDINFVYCIILYYPYYVAPLHCYLAPLSKKIPVKIPACDPTHWTAHLILFLWHSQRPSMSSYFFGVSSTIQSS